jgi:hypothetical protein
MFRYAILNILSTGYKFTLAAMALFNYDHRGYRAMSSPDDFPYPAVMRRHKGRRAGYKDWVECGTFLRNIVPLRSIRPKQMPQRESIISQACSSLALVVILRRRATPLFRR